MRLSLAGWPALLLFALTARADIPAGDSRRGEQLFRSEGCVQCHSLNGKGGTTAPDLGKLIDRNFTPASLAGTMWNHAPAMWTAMRRQGVAKASLSTESAADLFAYFYSTRFFDRPGDAARGKAAFTARRCTECHGPAGSYPGARPAEQWESAGHPIQLAQNMWNHAAQMREAIAKKGVAWPQLTSQELSDILVWVRNLPGNRNRPAAFYYEPAAGGEQVFQAKGCNKCHALQQNLEARIKGATLTDIAVDMWNHAPRLSSGTPTLSEDEMRKVLSYLWARQFFQGQGNAARGKRVFSAKGCARCHNDAASGAPNLASRKGTFSDISMVSVLWEHGPRMLESMNQRKIAWPRFETGQMADLIAYLNNPQ
jgi:cytochrome c551/c552